MQPEIYELMAAVERTHWWFVARRRILSTVLARLPLPQRARILEAGCGTGGNLQMLSGFGRVAGFEPDADARARALTKGDFDIREGRLPDCIPFEPESFDLVVALDVIEHLDDDRACTESLQRYVKPGGWGLFTVPAYRFLWSRHDEVRHHKRRYTRQAFTEMLTSSGFTPVYASYFNTLLFPVISGVRLGKNALKIDGADDDAMPSPFVNAVLRTLFASERHLMPRVTLPFGVSILTTARRADE